MEIMVIVHHAGNSAQVSFSSAHTKLFQNQGHTSPFLEPANENYVANLHGVKA
jgi:hypothetical protein